MPKKIFIGYVQAGRLGVIGYALCEDGYGLATHCSSDEEWSKHDMGLTSNWKHEAYKEHCPEGFELEWIGDIETTTHEGWQAAMKLNEDLHPDPPGEGDPDDV